jgi:hypothetical protein
VSGRSVLALAVCARGLLHAARRAAVFGAGAVAGQGGGVLGPQGLHLLAELLQAGDLVVAQGR